MKQLTRSDGLTATYNTQSYSDYYFIRCEGRNHTDEGTPASYPRYSSVEGLIKR